MGKKASALELATRLVAAAPDADTRVLAQALQVRIQLPMSVVLEKVRPGDSVAKKARDLKISRTTWYAWLEGRARPRRGLAEVLARETNFSWQEIAGVPA